MTLADPCTCPDWPYVVDDECVARADPIKPRTMVWERQPIDNHLWAFYYYCRRRGDRVRITKHGDGTATLTVTTNEETNNGGW